MNTAHRKFKHISSLHKDRVTIVLIALEDYSCFAKSIDHLYEVTDYPFDLLVIECQAPHAVQTSLEKKAKLYKNMRILYAHHQPLLADAYNLALAHVRTPLALFIDNRIVPEKGWLADMVRELRLYNADVLCPVITDLHDRPVPAMAGQAFLATREALNALGEFDHKLPAVFFPAELTLRCRARDIDLKMDPATALKRDFSLPSKAADKRLFDRQWSPECAQDASVEVHKKWGLAIDPAIAQEWLGQRLKGGREPVWASLRVPLDYLNSGLSYAKLGLTRLMHSLIQI